jgi:hypothetical protein
MEVADNHSWGKDPGTSMRESGVVFARVPAALRPQIQEAASAPQFTAGRVLQGESMLEGKVLLRITFPRQQLHGCLANGNQ